ncbi:hypothetical protein Mgra_00007363 [Meloidogyne graminicola]|uniref:Uncharacterized protein n=1 Tax=Meloidogyne graminicola TaxID=189291 RepID=A0A8S9ZIP4_9BILA|nr:hypothetical protein Mgra_00007363 [Meloidogyne graminicola]
MLLKRYIDADGKLVIICESGGVKAVFTYEKIDDENFFFLDGKIRVSSSSTKLNLLSKENRV